METKGKEGTVRSEGIERSLIEKARGGDRGSQEVLLSRYESRLFDLIMRIVRNREDAMDVLQDTMVKAIVNIDRFDPNRDFGKWLMRIATTTSLDHLRKQRRRANLRERYHDLLTTRREPRVDAHLEERLTHEAVERAMGSLDPRYRSVLILRYRNDFSYAEIAEVLSIPIGTVKVLLHRAHRALKEAVRKEGSDESL